MVTKDVEDWVIDILSNWFQIKQVDYISWCEGLDALKIKDVSRGNINQSSSYSKIFTKLWILNKTMFPYKKVIFLGIYSINTIEILIQQTLIYFHYVGLIVYFRLKRLLVG